MARPKPIWISNFRDIDPPGYISQEQSLNWLTQQHITKCPDENPATITKYFGRYGIKSNKIQGRRVAADDMLNLDFNNQEMFGGGHHLDLKYKTRFFRSYAENIFNQIYPESTKLPDHIIHVSCTGYVAPSAPQVLISDRGASTKVTHAYHMGCYAAIPAIRMATSFVGSEESLEVDVVHTEACSIHINPTIHTPEQIVVQSLFADGNIAYRVGNTSPQHSGLEFISQREMIVPDSVSDMRWEPESWGFNMTLSRNVPQKIASALPEFLKNLAQRSDLSVEELQKQATFAVHPGGPQIIDSVQTLLDLREEQVSDAKQVLFLRGNMSSATLPHVWQRILKSEPSDGHLVVSLAFGPGLTIFGGIYRCRRF